MNRRDLLAHRLEQFDSSAIRYAFSLAEKIHDPIDLSIGFPEDNTPSSIKAAGISAIRQNHTRYTPTNGTLPLRLEIAKKLKKENHIALDPGRVTVVPGLTTGILLIYLSILNPGDEIILPDPFFPPYRDLAVMLGAKVVHLDTLPDFQVTAEKLAKIITPKTKAILINSPNNPSGAVYPESELRKIAKLADKHNIVVISDEIYEHFSYDKPHFSIGSIYENTLTMNGFSKAFAMTGWRLGYIAGPQIIISAINELEQYVVFSSSSIAQAAALEALRYNPEKMTKKYKKKRDITLKAMRKDFEIHGAEGAFYVFAKLPEGIDDLEFVNLAAKRGLIILPGRAFSMHHNYIRVAFGNNIATIQAGLKILHEIMTEQSEDRVSLGKRHRSI
ncbi:aminotransferase class I/II-fold pyridoxal phosphate-dependent enzyme [bacterium]|nr:aminotransferase class I/II-fold pyridoxal phosphate-dependent enzyme [bacterium]